jgi:hypothetical protein
MLSGKPAVLRWRSSRETLALALLVAAASSGAAQYPSSTQPAPAQYAAQSGRSGLDPRWTPWIGCWQADTTAGYADPSQSLYTCVVPIAGTTGVQQLTIARGKVTGRRRLIANGANNSFDENGCRGTRAVEWASTGRRVYIHSNYTCDVGLAGTSSGVLAITSTGNWLEVETVHAGQGLIEHVDQWRDAGMPSSLPSEVFNSLESRRMTSTTARASAAAPLTVADVIDALHHVDSSAVRTLIVASGQQFSLNGNEVAALFRANVPRGVLQAMVAWTPQPGAEAPGYDPDAYLRATAGMNYGPAPQVIVIQPAQQQPGVVVTQEVTPEPMSPTYCTALGCYPTNQMSAYNGNPYPYMDFSNPYYPYPYNFYPFSSGPILTGRINRPVVPFRRGPFGVQKPIAGFPNRPGVGRPGGVRGGHR